MPSNAQINAIIRQAGIAKCYAEVDHVDAAVREGEALIDLIAKTFNIKPQEVAQIKSDASSEVWT